MDTRLKVTIAGTTGAIGPALLEALYSAGYEVQALTRRHHSPKENKASLSSGIKVIQVDYDKPYELHAALTGQDVVISTLGDVAGAVSAQHNLIQASIIAGVQRFIPSEFGSDTMNDRVRTFPFFADKLRHQETLKTAAETNAGFSYTIVITGPFLDWGLSVVPFIIDVGSRKAEVFDGGNVRFSTTRISTLAKAIQAILQNPHDTANRTLYIHDGITTQNQLISRFQALSTSINTTPTDSNSQDETSLPPVDFLSIPISTRQLEQQAWKSYNSGTPEPVSWIFPFINISIWSAEELCVFAAPDNALLGLPVLKGKELEAVLDEEIIKAVQGFEVAAATVAREDEDLAEVMTQIGDGVETEGERIKSAAAAKAAQNALEEGRRKLVGWEKVINE